MKQFNLCLLGFGNVGQALLRLLQQQTPTLRELHAIEWRLTGLASRRLGMLADPHGLDARAVSGGRTTAALPFAGDAIGPWLHAAGAQVVFEATALDTRAGEPALSYLRTALAAGVHTITANKGPLVYGYPELRDLGVAHGAHFRFESTVMDGAPIFSLFRALPLLTVHAFRGILNSTTNLILTEMERGASFPEGVAEAQRRGLAETDPSADIDGWDAAVKVAALAQVLMQAPLAPAAIARRGIRDLDPDRVRAARAAGTPYKLLCWATRESGRFEAGVAPRQLAGDDPLAGVDGTSSAVHFATDLLPGLTVVEHDPTPTTTAYGMLADFVEIANS